MVTILRMLTIDPRISSFIDNTNIIGRYKNFNVLFFKEALKINERKPALNTGLKVFK